MTGKEWNKDLEKKIDGLLKNPPGYELSEAKRRELIGMVYGVHKERKHIVSFEPLRNVFSFRAMAVASALVCLVAGFNYLFSPLYPVVTNIKGTVKICRASNNEWVFAEKANMRIGKNDILKTFDDGQADLEIPGLYHIRLKNNSEIKLAESTSRAVSRDMKYALSQGKVFTHYNKLRKTGKFLGIETPQAEASALGTDFMVESTLITNNTMVGVLDGLVKVGSLSLSGIPGNSVMVRAGQRTTVRRGAAPSKPARLMENELLDMEEFYSIGTKPQVALLISSGPARTRELLSFVPLYISSEKPGILPEKIMNIAKVFSQAIREGSVEKHMESIKDFEAIVNSYPNPKYDVQFLLFIGSYYAYVGEYQKAVMTFEAVARNYSNSIFASIAQCAIGIIYEEKLKDFDRARSAYQKVMSNYPNSPEVEEASAGLNRLTR